MIILFKQLLLVKMGKPLLETVQVQGDFGAEVHKEPFRLRPPNKLM